jgi:hypothetical protein
MLGVDHPVNASIPIPTAVPNSLRRETFVNSRLIMAHTRQATFPST